MPPKQHTPYQINKGLEYVRKVPPFLQAMMEKEQIRPPEQEKFRIDSGDEDDYDEQDEIDGAQIVVMKEGKHLSEDQVQEHMEKNGKSWIINSGNGGESSESDKEDVPAVDANGKILFRRPKSKKKGEVKNSKAKDTDAAKDLAQEIEEMKEKLGKKRKQGDEKEERNGDEKTKKKKGEDTGNNVTKKEKKKGLKGAGLLSFDQED
ncbi:hypothetical protein BC936DRAFT_146822 [Jimgerdemannia flammicorona]|uniref:DUF4604 domain-containing protein n=1 Tax=Jimgerdemannia flammicorona TaxID=994334 RepID=A0A433D7F6_9FUNG|nr:hypothetical protein BC936DRAFT_146822 [Jimgerdemannia flammicorona]